MAAAAAPEPYATEQGGQLQQVDEMGYEEEGYEDDRGRDEEAPKERSRGFAQKSWRRSSRTQIQKGHMANALRWAGRIRKLGIPALKVGKYTNMLVKSAAFFGVEVSGMARTHMRAHEDPPVRSC